MIFSVFVDCFLMCSDSVFIFFSSIYVLNVDSVGFVLCMNGNILFMMNFFELISVLLSMWF